MASAVRIERLTRRFDGSDRPAVDRLDLHVDAGEVVCLVGPSGCGKSTTLRLVAGLDIPDSGSIRIGERSMNGVPPQERDVAMVFQGFALYPHMSVRDNLAFPLKMHKMPAGERARAVERTAELLGITRLLARRPGELSGGEQQRVAMGRAIVRQPEAFLFDEPLSNLDAALRAELRVELGKLLERLGATALYVTHDQAEAMTLGRRIAVLRNGRLEQCDTPRRIYEAPATTFVASFFGTPPMNLIELERDGELARRGAFSIAAPPGDATKLVLGVRPEHLHLAGHEPYGASGGLGSVVPALAGARVTARGRDRRRGRPFRSSVAHARRRLRRARARRKRDPHAPTRPPPVVRRRNGSRARLTSSAPTLAPALSRPRGFLPETAEPRVPVSQRGFRSEKIT
jgi:sn-glycerol 3-phosphate transport system ATP-binding protein